MNDVDKGTGVNDVDVGYVSETSYIIIYAQREGIDRKNITAELHLYKVSSSSFPVISCFGPPNGRRDQF